MEDSTQLDNALYQACIAADLPKVKLLVNKQNAQVNKIIGPPGQLDYSLNYATKTGSVPLVRFLLDHGATVNAAALRIAAFEGDQPMLQLLLEPVKALLVSSGMSRKWRVDLASILVGTTRRGRSETAELLKVFRSRIEEFDKAVDAGLLAACAAGDMRSVKYFIDMGAGNKVEALSTAAEYHQFEPLGYFLENHSFEPEELVDPLTSAAGGGHMPSILLLIEQGAEDESGAALARAAKFSHAEVLKHFLGIFRYTKEKLSTALVAAARAGDTAIMEVLIRRGAHGSGVLVFTVQRSHLAATELLIRELPKDQAELSKALEKAMFIWLRPVQARKPHLSRTSSHSSRSTDSDIEPTIPEVLRDREESRRRIVDVLLEAGGRLSELYYCRLLEMMILTQNQYGVELLHDSAKFTTVDTLPDDYLVSLAIYHQQDEMVDLLLGFPVAHRPKPPESTELSSVQPIVDDTYTWESNVYNPIPSPLILAAKFRNEHWCRTLVRREETDANEWCFYKPSRRLLSFYGSDKKTHTPKEEQYEELGCPFGTESLHDCALSTAINSRDVPIIHLLIESGADPWANRQRISIFELAAKQNYLRDILSFLEEFATVDIDRREWHGGRSMLAWAAIYGNGDLVDMFCKKGATIDLADSLFRTPLHLAVAAGNIGTVKGLLWAGASTSRRDVDAYLCADELAAKLAQEASWSDQSRAVRFEIIRFLEDWIKNNMDHLDAANIRRESKAAEERAKVEEASVVAEDDLLDHFSDDDSVHWSDEE
ncbi:ankyrin [Aureobasidium namibiae CBS 147.97]|uniref:Ankyrin n=1 Tax=Aureobasidium namibiae CBS 147.97 TaxID=1043004 RepID=A0A074WXI2_9PEZI